MALDPAADQREGNLVARRIRQLNEQPPIGNFDLAHLQAVHAYLFQDLPHHRPGVMRSDTSSWSKTRRLEGRLGTHDVHYAADNIAGRIDATLRVLGGPTALTGLAPDAFAGRMARLYGDLDHAHAFYEGNSRTLREFTRSLAQTAGYELNWAPTGATVEQRNRLYIARDIAVLDRAYPGLTPERGMQTNDRNEYEASLALPALRRRGPILETIIREGLTPLPQARQEAAADTAARSKQTRPALDTLMVALRGPTPTDPTPGNPEPTSMAERLAAFEARQAAKDAAKAAPKSIANPNPAPDSPPVPKPSRGPGPGS